MADLFSAYPLKSVQLRNRIVMSPLCQYSAVDAVPNDWQLVKLGSRTAGAVGGVLAEATAVSPEGRITVGDTRLWSDAQAESVARIARFVESQGAVPGIRLAHAGRKASALRPWEGQGQYAATDPKGWEILGPSAEAFGGPLTRVPAAMTLADIARVRDDFVAAARRALAAGFRWLVLHYAHGYLAQSFLSPLANHRSDAYGGDVEGRARFLLKTFAAVRAVWPEHLPRAVRLGVIDYVDGE